MIVNPEEFKGATNNWNSFEKDEYRISKGRSKHLSFKTNNQEIKLVMLILTRLVQRRFAPLLQANCVDSKPLSTNLMPCHRQVIRGETKIVNGRWLEMS